MPDVSRLGTASRKALGGNVKEEMKTNRFLQRRLAGAMLLIGSIMIIAWGWQVGRLALSLRDRVARLQAMAADPRQANLPVLAQEIRGARLELTALRDALSPLLWLGEQLGGDLAVGRPLMETAVESAAAGDEALSALAPSLKDITPASFSMSALPRALDALTVARPTLKRAAMRLDIADTAVARVRGPLSPRVEQWVARASKLVKQARQAMGAALIAPEILGQDGPRTYLVLVQNSDELRPTGGFISNVGRIVINHGRVISQTFEDSYAVDDFTHPYPDPPRPLLDYMSIDQWVFRDANWSPDFPISARDAIRLYNISRPERIDGVIAVNQNVVQALLPGMEPLGVEGMSEPLTVANAERMFQEAWNPGTAGTNLDWFRNRKQFIGAIAQAMIDKTLGGNVNWARLGQGVLDTLRQRQVMIYSTGSEATELARLNWDGALRQTQRNSDYLMIVDANVGYGKVNPLIHQQVDYRVTLGPDGTGRASVTLDYGHRGTWSGVVCTPLIPYGNDITYEKTVNRCYYDYLRLMVPQGSRLQAATAHSAPGTYFWSGKPADGRAQMLPDEAGRSVMAKFFVVEYGSRLQTQFEYNLPKVVTSDSSSGRQLYALTLQKQSGTGPLPIKVTVVLPSGAKMFPGSTIPRSNVQTASSLQFDLTLDVDQQIIVEFVSGK